MALVAPFLDRDFQKVARLSPRQVDLYSRLALIASRTIVATPSPFIESESSRSTVLLDEELQSCGHLQLSYREVSLEEFGSKKIREYSEIEEYLEVYNEKAIEILLKQLCAPRRSRDTEIGKTMRKIWLAEIEDTRKALGLRHALKCASVATLDAFRNVPEATRGRAFVWEEVFRALDSAAPCWRDEASCSIIKALISRHYFQALTSASDVLVSFDDFPAYPADQGLTHSATLRLTPLLRLLAACGLLEWLRSCPASLLLEVLNSPQIEDFRLAYQSVALLGNASDGDDAFLQLQEQYLRELEYSQARAIAKSRYLQNMTAFTLLGASVSRVKRQKTPVATFIEGLRRVEDKMRSRKVGEVQLSVYNYNVEQAAVVGPGATAYNFTQIGRRK